jgi:hypothetical protein
MRLTQGLSYLRWCSLHSSETGYAFAEEALAGHKHHRHEGTENRAIVVLMTFMNQSMQDDNHNND